MEVRARDILHIENKALGYKIDYLLDTYRHEFKKGYVYFQGYPRFFDMEGPKSKIRRWDKERKRAYMGSVTHFFASVAQGTTANEGFSMIEIIKKPNANKPSPEEVKEAREKIKIAGMNGITISANSQERSVLSRAGQSDFISYTNNKPYPADSLFTLVDEQLFLHFKNEIRIKYDKEVAESGFTGKYKDLNFQESTISLPKGETKVTKDGILLDPLGILFQGYMGWEKLADTLPINYKAPLSK